MKRPIPQGPLCVDADMVPFVAARTWCRSSTGGYAYTRKARGAQGSTDLVRVKLHRLVVGAPDRVVVDHINGDVLDNRRVNLRTCTVAENTRNRSPLRAKSGYKGVFRKKNGRYFASIVCDMKTHYLGSFGCAVEAAKAYDEAAIRLHGAFAVLNFAREGFRSIRYLLATTPTIPTEH